jgi:hypothetical protein
MEQFLEEQLQLAESEIRKLIDYLISNLPSFFKERLAVCCWSSRAGLSVLGAALFSPFLPVSSGSVTIFAP